MVAKKGKNLKNQKGKKLARERLSLLFDNGEFTEIDPYVKHFQMILVSINQELMGIQLLLDTEQ